MFKEYSRQRYNRWIFLLPVASLTVGVVLTYQMTAIYQMHVAKAWYLTRHFPPEEMQALLNWLARSGFSYFDMAMGGWEIGEEILKLTTGCQVSILYSHVYKSEDDEILAFLASSGLQLLDLRKYRGASVATLSRCLD